MNKKIPKVIHYCWFGRGKLPELAEKCINSWKQFLPDYEIKEWNEENFDVYSNKYIEEAYNSKKYAFVSDYARLKILYENGGIYFDVDVELIKRPDNEFLKNGYLSLEDDKHINTGLGFCSNKKNKVIKIMLDDYKDISFIQKNGKLDLTSCPIRNTKSLLKNGYALNQYTMEKLLILKPSYTNPIDYETGKINLSKETFSIHHYAASWLSDSDKKIHEISEKSKKYGLLKVPVYYINLIIYLILHDRKRITNRFKKIKNNEK